MSSRSISMQGKVAGLGAADAGHLCVVAVQGDTVLATAAVQADGTYRLALPRDAAAAKSPYALQLVVLPSTASAAPGRVANAPRVTLTREALLGEHPQAPALSVTPALLEDWLIFWTEWCVSGTVTGPNGCPAPNAVVTVSTVGWSSSGYSATPRTSATTGPDGTFSLCFPWWEEFFFCWPCRPYWWFCWPWWWEDDILHVIATLETRAAGGQDTVFLARPTGSALVQGQGFAAARAGGVVQSDARRTALIRRKFDNPALRAIFPWWWWCCRNPNIVFTVTQNGTTILAENPAIDTRWCMGSGESMTLVGNAATLTICPGGTLPESGVVWTSVGNLLTSSIDAGGLGQYTVASTDFSDVAFGGTLDPFAAMAPGAFQSYQILAAVWDAPLSRGGSAPAPATGTPVGVSLYLPVWIYDPATHGTTYYSVQMGPFSAGGVSNLYATPAWREELARNGVAPPAGLAAFPAIPAGGTVFWGYQGLMLSAPAGSLLLGASFGAVDLTIIGYDGSFNEVLPDGVAPDAPLTLTIDTTGISTAVGPITVSGSAQLGTGECPAYDVGPDGTVQIPVSVTDTTGFVCEYELVANWGNSNSAAITPPGLRGYRSNPPGGAGAPNYPAQSWMGASETMVFPGSTPGVGSPPPDCCYEFLVRSSKRVTDGYGWPTLADGAFQTINLKFSS